MQFMTTEDWVTELAVQEESQVRSEWSKTMQTEPRFTQENKGPSTNGPVSMNHSLDILIIKDGGMKIEELVKPGTQRFLQLSPGGSRVSRLRLGLKSILTPPLIQIVGLVSCFSRMMEIMDSLLS